RRGILGARNIVLDDDARRTRKDVSGLARAHRIAQANVHGLGVGEPDRHPNRRRHHLDIRRVQDLARLLHHLPLFLARAVLHEGVDVWKEIESNLLWQRSRWIDPLASYESRR